VGMLASLLWLMLSAPAFQYIYGWDAIEASKRALVPFSQPGLVTIPLGFAVLVFVSLLTQRSAPRPAVAS
jgi:cation/acetate symporter